MIWSCVVLWVYLVVLFPLVNSFQTLLHQPRSTTPARLQATKDKELPAKKQRRKPSVDTDPEYWLLDGRETANLTLSESGELQSLHFWVGGNPRSLQRHRTSRGFMYNPSAPAQRSFRTVIGQLLDTEVHVDDLDPLFGDALLSMTIVFRLKRPLKHFSANRPGPGRFRPSAPEALSPTRPDVDNLAKFILDSGNGLLYEDDCQILDLRVRKCLDDDGECRGSTEVRIERVAGETGEGDYEL